MPVLGAVELEPELVLLEEGVVLLVSVFDVGLEDEVDSVAVVSGVVGSGVAVVLSGSVVLSEVTGASAPSSFFVSSVGVLSPLSVPSSFPLEKILENTES